MQNSKAILNFFDLKPKNFQGIRFNENSLSLKKNDLIVDTQYLWFIAKLRLKSILLKNFSKLLIFSIFTRLRNLRYKLENPHKSIMQSHGAILKKYDIIEKFKYKNWKFYYLSLAHIIKELEHFSQRINIFYIKGPNIFSFLNTFKFWKKITFAYKLKLILSLNRNYIDSGAKKKSIKRRLKKKIVALEGSDVF